MSYYQRGPDDLRSQLHYKRNRQRNGRPGNFFNQQCNDEASPHYYNNVVPGNYNPNFFPNPTQDGFNNNSCDGSGNSMYMGHRRDGATMAGQQHQQQPYYASRINVHVNNQFGNEGRWCSYEEPANICSAINPQDRPHHAGSFSVRIPSEDNYHLNESMFSRRSNFTGAAPQAICPPVNPPTQCNDAAVVFDYNHQQSRPSRFSEERDKSANRNRSQRDPRVQRYISRNLVVLKKEKPPCESQNSKSIDCAHPEPNVLIKSEKGCVPAPAPVPAPGRPIEAVQPSKIVHFSLDRVEREKYEKSKMEKSRNLTRPVPRPPKDPELESELNVVIEKLNVPVITTPANFTNYKIPRMESDRKIDSTSGGIIPTVAVAATATTPKTVPSTLSKSISIIASISKENHVDSTTNTKQSNPKDDKPKEKKTAVPVVALKTPNSVVRNKAVERVVRTSVESVSPRRESTESSDVEGTKSRFKKIVPTSESDSESGLPIAVLKSKVVPKRTNEKSVTSLRPHERSRERSRERIREQRPVGEPAVVQRTPQTAKSGKTVSKSRSYVSSAKDSTSSRSRNSSGGRSRSDDSEDCGLNKSKKKLQANKRPIDSPDESSISNNKSKERESSGESKDSGLKKTRSKSRNAQTVPAQPPEVNTVEVPSTETQVKSVPDQNEIEDKLKKALDAVDLLQKQLHDLMGIRTSVQDTTPEPSAESNNELVSNSAAPADPQIHRGGSLKCPTNLSVALDSPQSPTISSCERIDQQQPPAVPKSARSKSILSLNSSIPTSPKTSSGTNSGVPAESPRTSKKTKDVTVADTWVDSTCQQLGSEMCSVEIRNSPKTLRSIMGSPNVSCNDSPNSVQKETSRHVRFADTCRESPKAKRNRKNELEKLQDDNNRNFKLHDMMSGRAAKDQPKKVIQRRKSMCSSVSSEGIKLTITREPQKLKSAMKRRLSVGSAFVEPQTYNDDIRNDDPFYDMDAGNCRLCTKSSGDMAQHYIQNHPDSEVYCCRIKLNTALKIRAGENLDVLVNGDSSEYNCLICETTQSCETYYTIYKHLISHTGEFYFKCKECEFGDVTYNSDHAKQHNFEICPYPEIVQNRILAYMCEQCNFIQLHKRKINNHIMCHHREESPKPKCKEVTLLDFGRLTISYLDVEDLDEKFKHIPVITRHDEGLEQLEDLFAEYLSKAPSPEIDYTGDLSKLHSFESDVEKLMSIEPLMPMVPPTKERTSISIGNLKYDIATGTFEFKHNEWTYRNKDFDKVMNYLTEISATGVEWNGFCRECDENFMYSDPHPVHMELQHLRNVHWYEVEEKRSAQLPEVAARSGNVLQPWLLKENNKCAAELRKMLSIQGILSAYKCMAKNCDYFTNSLDGIAKHLDQHDDEAADEDDLIACCYCDAEISNVADYLSHLVSKHSSCRYYCPYCYYRSCSDNVHHHLQVYHPDRNPFMFDGENDGLYTMSISDDESLCAHLETNVKPYRCPDCPEEFFPLDLYQQHLEQKHGRGYFCNLCSYEVPILNFLPHIATHNQGPFACIFCPFGAKDGPAIKRHVIDNHPSEEPSVCVRFVRHGAAEQHNELSSLRLCLISYKDINDTVIKEVPREVFEELQENDGDLVMSDVQGDCGDAAMEDLSNAEFDRFIMKLPRDHVFETSIGCPKCKYSTTIRTNLIRHLDLHTTNPNIDQENDPVNRMGVQKSLGQKRAILIEANVPGESSPVKPIKKRRMTISEMSSTDFDAPQYIPVNQRFICGVKDCTYLAFEERMFKLHIDTIHANDQQFKCPHCDKVLEFNDFDVEIIAAHYKLHDNQLFKCSHCPFFADTRHNVSKHIRKRHLSTVNEEDIQEVRCVQEKKQVAQKPTKTQLMRRNSVSSCKRPRIEDTAYGCCYCPFESNDVVEMNKHNHDVHNHFNQFECSDCGATPVSEKGFKIHANLKHKGKRPHMIRHFKVVSECETTKTDNASTEKSSPRNVVPVLKELSSDLVRGSPKKEANFHMNVRLNYKTRPVHQPLVYFCEVCPEKFNDWNSIFEHYQRKHSTAQFIPKLPAFLMYSCFLCQFNALQQQSLAEHFVNSHDNIPPLYRLEYLVKCMKCDMSNTTEKVLTHYAECHKDAIPLMRKVSYASCGLCPFQYKDEADLSEHFKTEHKKVVSPSLKLNDHLKKRLLNLKVNKIVKCKECKEVVNKHTCRFPSHETVCVECVERYHCRICGYMSAVKAEAEGHIKRHKEECLACERCKATFSNYDVLLMHITEHRQADDYKAELNKQYSLEIIHPNGMVTYETTLSGKPPRN